MELKIKTIGIKSLEDVNSYFEAHSEKWNRTLRVIEDKLMEARDGGEAPLYLTKSRIKQTASAYLKLKRKNRDTPESITDWIGLRVLCLFQQDIEPTFSWLIRLMLNQIKIDAKGDEIFFDLKEIKVFNWPTPKAKNLISLLKAELTASKLNTTIKDDPHLKDQPYGIEVAVTMAGGENISFPLELVKRGSGYQSVHFVVEAKLSSSAEPVSCEVQLRTLLQDVWGELEHALSYKKGKIHPHIRNSFQLLSTELEAKDILVSQLRDIRDEEAAFAHYAHVSSGPSRWLNYTTNFMERIFNQPEIEKLGEYKNTCNERRTSSDPIDWGKRAEEKLNELVANLKDTNSNQSKYFESMERAFIKFCIGQMSEAEEEYRSVTASEFGSKEWFPYFRIGEICLAQDKLEAALVAFDQCEDCMVKQNDTSTVMDRYAAKIGLAYSYWSLGSEFLPTAIEKMEEAKTLVDEYISNPDADIAIEDKNHLERSLANNLCYYYLERWIDTPENAKVSEVHKIRQQAAEQYKALHDLLMTDPDGASSNAYDTLAWYCYQCYLKEKDVSKAKECLDKAIQFIREGDRLSNLAPSRLTSMSIQREHIQTIMSKSER